MGFKKEAKKILEELWHLPDWHSDDPNEMADYQEREVTKALTSIINLVDKELPKFIDVGKYDLDCPPTDLHRAAGYNQAIDDMRAIIRRTRMTEPTLQEQLIKILDDYIEFEHEDWSMGNKRRSVEHTTLPTQILALIEKAERKARIDGMSEIQRLAAQRAEDDDVYTLRAFAEDVDTYLTKLSDKGVSDE